MTQKDKIMKANMLAMRVKSIASRLEQEAKDYDVSFPKQYAKELTSLAEEFLKLK